MNIVCHTYSLLQLCEIQSPQYMLCPTPKLDLDNVRTRKKKKRDLLSSMSSAKMHRVIRATSNDGESIIVDDVELTAGILLDGENITLKEFGNTLPMLQTYENPMLETFSGHDRIMTFISINIKVTPFSLHYLAFITK